jgi:hypothetical protein
MKNFYLCLLFIYLFASCSFTAQAQERSFVSYIGPEIMLGKIVKTNSFFPETNFQKRCLINIGRIHTGSNSWAGFFNYPASGFSLAFSKLGNDTVFGNAYGILKYIEFRPARKLTNSLSFQTALGASYFDLPYHSEFNPLNKALGSHINWSFRLFAYYNFYTNSRLIFRFGGGYLHSSNGHVRLPNFGLNSGAMSFSVLFSGKSDAFPDQLPKTLPDKKKHYSLQLRQGFGFHALGGTSGPPDSPVKPVYTSELSAGIIFRQYLKFYAGFTHRRYRHFSDYYSTASAADVYRFKSYNANLYFFLGLELLMGNVSMNMNAGLTIFKPFYRDFDNLYQNSKPLDYALKYLFPTRLGLKYYLLKTQYHPKNNFYFGAAINANFGEADFSEFSIGFVRTFR